MTFVENGTKVSAYSPKTFVFERDMSAGDPEVDLVTIVNIPAVVSPLNLTVTLPPVLFSTQSMSGNVEFNLPMSVPISTSKTSICLPNRYSMTFLIALQQK